LACAQRASTAVLGFVARRQVETRMGVQTEVDSSNGLDDVMLGDDECSVGMQDRAGMGITKWLAQLAQAGKARFGLGRKQATSMHVVAVVGGGS
jgi:hypothetical protein